MKLPYVWIKDLEEGYVKSNSPFTVRKTLDNFRKGLSNLTDTIAYASTRAGTGVNVGRWDSCDLFYRELEDEHKAVIDKWYSMVATKLEDVI